MPTLTVVVGTTQPWPEARMTLESIHDQTAAVDGEVIVVDATGSDCPAEVAERFPRVRWVSKAGASIFALRAVALREARGDVIAETEDHVRVDPDWCERILAAHDAHPDVPLIGGVIDNGCPEKLRDWAHHFLVFGPVVSPIEEGEGAPLSGAANLTFKRSVVPAELPDDGVVEMLFVDRLRADGARSLADGTIRVEHLQSFPFATFCRYHFHNGRSIAGFRLREISPAERAVRLVTTPVLPAYLVGLRAAHIWPKRSRRRTLIGSLPWLAGLCVAHAAGEAVGYVAGTGRSPEHLR
jgi:hypothetical protein